MKGESGNVPAGAAGPPASRPEGGLLLPQHQQIMKRLSSAPIRRLLLLSGAALAAFSRLSAQDSSPVVLPPYVLSATRTPAPLTTTGSAVDTLSGAELARMQLTGLQAALAAVPGAPAFASGAPGGAVSLFLRGTNSNQTLFLVDGIRFSDPNTDYAIALGGLCVGACDSLEVAHGPQSTLYGGDAVGGVLSLRAQRGSGPASGAVSAEAGSFGTVQGAVSAQGGGDTAYSFSAAGGTTQNDRPNNDFTSATFSLRLDRRLSERAAVGATWRGFVGRYGSPGDRYTDDPDNQERETNQLATVFGEFAPSAALTSRVVLGGQYRSFKSVNPGPGGTSVTLVRNRRAVLDWQATLQAGERHRVTAGVTAEANHTRNTGFGDIDESQQLFAVFAQDEWTPVERVHLTAGLRSDDHDTFGRATTGRATAAWLSPAGSWKLRASYGTAFRAPGFLDLYGQSAFYVGNPALRPERARGWDAGIDWFLGGGRGVASLTWFDTRLTDLIVYDFGVFPGTTANVERARTRGVEASAKFALAGIADVRLSYTYLEADNLTQGARLLRRPRHSGAADVWRRFGGGFSAGAGVAFVSDRQDVDAATFATVEGEDYTVARVYAEWRIGPSLALKARVENLLDERYEQVNGYPQPGRGAFAGVEWRW
jgi:vitamin B12 transporter